MKKNQIFHNSGVYFQLAYPKIIETLRLAASEPLIQEKSFLKTESPPEEVSFLVEHAKMMSTVLYKNGYISKSQLDSIIKLDEQFECFEKEDWTVSAMHKSKNWQITRKLGMQCLYEFSADKAIPNLYWYKEKK